MKAKFENAGSTTLRTVRASDHPVRTTKVTILTGQNLTEGAVIGKITASSKHILSLSGAADGSQTPDLILAEDVDATAADVEAIAYLAGHFVGSELTVGTGHTLDSIKEGLRVKGIFID